MAEILQALAAQLQPRLTPDDPLLRNALESAAAGASLTEALLETGLFSEETLYETLSTYTTLPLSLDAPHDEDIPSLREACPASLAIKFQVLPLAFEGERLVLLTADPYDLEQRQILPKLLAHPITWCLAPRTHLRTRLAELYGIGADTFERILEGSDYETALEEEGEKASVLDAEDADEASVLAFVNQIIRVAIERRATDIHFEPQAHSLRIRFRIDGHLENVPVPENIVALRRSVVARLKIMSQLDVAEHRVPQDGRIHLENAGKSVDVRVATIPSIEGETVSLRLLNQEKFSLHNLELEPHLEARIQQALQADNGIILVTGPTGSGKSTSLYCFLSTLNRDASRIVTIEDPIENKIPGVVQIAVRPNIGLTFASGLRSILRADPDIAMVGEIRDTETAEVAIRASLTGHLVFSTLHTNTAIGGVSRLLDMDIQPFLLAASARAFLAQRLVRRLCPHCRRPASQWDPVQARQLGCPEDLLEAELTPYEAVGCERCRQTGYQGRIAIFEFFPVSADIQRHIVERASEQNLHTTARREGFESLLEYGWRKIARHDTTVAEVLSVTSHR